MKDSSGAATMINARAETVATKPAFLDAMKSRRCLIPADNVYEWSRMGKAKQSYCFEVNVGELFVLAGLGLPCAIPQNAGLQPFRNSSRFRQHDISGILIITKPEKYRVP